MARNHLLVLYSRHGAFDEARFDQLAYQRRDLFEYWAHEASYVLSEDLPIHRWMMRPPTGWRTRLGKWWDGEAEFRAHILERLTADGPLRARDIEDRASVQWESSGWTHARNLARMRDLMWVRGHVGISRRDGAPRRRARAARAGRRPPLAHPRPLPNAIRRELERLAAWRGATGNDVLAAPAEWRQSVATL